MRLNTLAFTVGLAVMSASAYSAVTLDGRSLTQEQAWAAANGEEVVIAPEAMKHLTDSYNLVMTAARQGVEIYGLTVGVGLNKDHHLFDARVNSPTWLKRRVLTLTATFCARILLDMDRRSIRRSCACQW